MVRIIKPANPVARDMAYDRRKWANRVVLAKKGKGSYNRGGSGSKSTPAINRRGVIDVEV